ncbi:hypothetical protein I6U33_25935 [Pseudomonas carnis]|uniref:hypothetical protein n=1 Tax=Pseudomonas carnis TaxID=2487355 RepID=UPI001C6FB624|nr:hypothetical protein [Pseudomonas carnis]MBW9240775.1 hypothetical protein [Pseudomonas carnis]
MPTIQTEQDSPETLAKARARHAHMTNQLRRFAGNQALQYGSTMHETGYLAALLMHGLISNPVYDQLFAELEQVQAEFDAAGE